MHYLRRLSVRAPPVGRSGVETSHEHDEKHMSRASFLKSVRTQLAIDRGKYQIAVPLNYTAPVESFHKYVFVAKGVEARDLRYLR
jgi:hypothetical protein